MSAPCSALREATALRLASSWECFSFRHPDQEPANDFQCKGARFLLGIDLLCKEQIIVGFHCWFEVRPDDTASYEFRIDAACTVLADPIFTMVSPACDRLCVASSENENTALDLNQRGVETKTAAKLSARRHL
jgi:hypothetical protein